MSDVGEVADVEDVYLGRMTPSSAWSRESHPRSRHGVVWIMGEDGQIEDDDEFEPFDEVGLVWIDHI